MARPARRTPLETALDVRLDLDMADLYADDYDHLDEVDARREAEDVTAAVRMGAHLVGTRL